MNARGIDAAWREAAEITYRDYVIDYGNDGRPEDDRVLPAEERQRQQAAIALIAEQTGISAEFIYGQLLDAAYAYGQAPGTDADPDYLGPPDWEDLATRWRERQIFLEAGRQETALWRRLSNAPTPVQHQFWAEQAAPDSPTISESRLVAAYRAVAERSGIALVTDPALDDRGNPILANGQGMILSDGTFFWSGLPEDLVGSAAAPTDAGQTREGPPPHCRHQARERADLGTHTRPPLSGVPRQRDVRLQWCARDNAAPGIESPRRKRYRAITAPRIGTE